MSRFGKWPLLAAAMALVIMLLFAAAYAWLVMPRYSQLEQMEQTVQSEKKVLAALKQKLSLSPEKTAETVAALQKKVPVHPLTDQLLLLFQKAEYVADSRLVSVQFSDEGAASSQQNGNGTNNGGEGTQAAGGSGSLAKGPDATFDRPGASAREAQGGAPQGRRGGQTLGRRSHEE